MTVNRIAVTAVVSSLTTLAAVAVADALTRHISQTAQVTAATPTPPPVTYRGYVTDVPCDRSVELTDSRGVTTTIDVVISGPQNRAACAAGNPLDGQGAGGMTITEQTIDGLPATAQYTCEAGTEALTWLVYSDGTPASGIAAAGFCRGIGRLQP
jgi:hypothetical protein